MIMLHIIVVSINVIGTCFVIIIYDDASQVLVHW